MLSFNLRTIMKEGNRIGHKNKKTLVYQIKDTLESKTAYGQSKYFYKLMAGNGGIQDKIFSYSTFKSYMKHANYFANYCKSKYGCKTLSECREYVNEWLLTRNNLSASTQKLEAASLAKLYGCSTLDFIKTPPRRRQDIKRSRYPAKRDRNFSESKNKEFILFCKSTGLRRSEITALRGNQLVERDNRYYINVKGKGGKIRTSPIINNVDFVVDKMRLAGENKVWTNISSNADIHSYRSDYAVYYYNTLARDISCIPNEDRYYCKSDLSGVIYDKKAMLEVSQALGHNRINVIAAHYLR